jgi:hypothetical protein
VQTIPAKSSDEPVIPLSHALAAPPPLPPTRAVEEDRQAANGLVIPRSRGKTFKNVAIGLIFALLGGILSRQVKPSIAASVLGAVDGTPVSAAVDLKRSLRGNDSAIPSTAARTAIARTSPLFLMKTLLVREHSRGFH